MKAKFLCILGLAVGLFSAGTKANPDVFFKDSAKFKGAYLVHEFMGDDIKFKLSTPVRGVFLPSRGFDFLALKKFTAEFKYRPGFKDDMLKMFDMSFESKLGLKEFIRELNRLLRSFSQRVSRTTSSK